MLPFWPLLLAVLHCRFRLASQSKAVQERRVSVEGAGRVRLASGPRQELLLVGLILRAIVCRFYNRVKFAGNRL